MQTDATKMSREERRTRLEQRRSAVAYQLRRLATELTDIDRQLDDIEQSEGRGTLSALQGHVVARLPHRPRHVRRHRERVFDLILNQTSARIEARMTAPA